MPLFPDDFKAPEQQSGASHGFFAVFAHRIGASFAVLNKNKMCKLDNLPICTFYNPILYCKLLKLSIQKFEERFPRGLWIVLLGRYLYN